MGNPINRTDATGMCLDEDGDGKCDPGWQCEVLIDPRAQEACRKANCDDRPDAGRAQFPGPGCRGDCYDAYLTYSQVVAQLHRIPSMAEVLYMTAATEYFAYVDFPYYNNNGYVEPRHRGYIDPTPRTIGQEALARSLYTACRDNAAQCSGMPLYKFLAGYQPWIGYAGEDHGDPIRRASELIEGGLNNNLASTGHFLRDDVGAILQYPDPDWAKGARPDRPWQWYTDTARYQLRAETFGLTSDKKAILAIDERNGMYTWMVTYSQTYAWWR